MKKKILCFSGWAQKHDSLKNIFEKLTDDYDIINFSYYSYKNIKDISQNISHQYGKNFDIICGWSLGGQIACRLLAEGYIKTNLLVLISTPFEFVKSERINVAMPVRSFIKFRDDFNKFPDKTLKKFAILSFINDKNSKYMIENLDINDKNYINLSFWLDQLGKFSCSDLNFKNLPKTLVFHGKGDMVVNFRQADFFVEKIEDCKKIVFNNCGHVPHINFLTQISDAINKSRN